MKKIEAIVRPEKLDVLIDRLEEVGITGLNISEVRGYGTQKGHSEMYRGVTYRIRLRQKIKVEVIVEYNEVDKIVEAIKKAVSTGEIGDGKIFISDVANAIRIRTGEEGVKAL